MKTHIFKMNHYIILGVLVITSLPMSAQDEHVKKFSREYKANGETALLVENKYGDVDFRDWEKSTVQIDVEIKLYHVSEQRAEQMFEKVSIKFNQTGNQISAITEYEEDFFRMAGRNNDLKNRKFEVNYIVKMPASVNLDVKNKYGSIFINKLTSPCSVTLKYGTLKINQLSAPKKSGMASIDMSYSKGNIEECQWLRLSSKYSSLNIDKMKALIAITKYSKLFIEQGSSLVCESKYDTYNIGELSNFVAEAQYSNFRIDGVSKKISLETKYTDSKIGLVPAGFERIDIENSYGSINIGISQDASYQLSSVAKYAKVHFPEDNNVNRFQESTEQRLKGTVGSNKSTKAEVVIDTRYGGIRLY